MESLRLSLLPQFTVNINFEFYRIEHQSSAVRRTRFGQFNYAITYRALSRMQPKTLERRQHFEQYTDNGHRPIDGHLEWPNCRHPQCERWNVFMGKIAVSVCETSGSLNFLPLLPFRIAEIHRLTIFTPRNHLKMFVGKMNSCKLNFINFRGWNRTGIFYSGVRR